MLRSPQNRGFVRLAVQGVLPNPPQSGEFVAKLVARLEADRRPLSGFEWRRVVSGDSPLPWGLSGLTEIERVPDNISGLLVGLAGAMRVDLQRRGAIGMTPPWSDRRHRHSGLMSARFAAEVAAKIRRV